MCAPVFIDEEDQSSDDIYQYTKNNCLKFVRTDKVCSLSTEGKQEQFNSLTTFLDLSSVYGNGPDILKQLRNRDYSLGYGLLIENKDRKQLFNLPTR